MLNPRNKNFRRYYMRLSLWQANQKPFLNKKQNTYPKRNILINPTTLKLKTSVYIDTTRRLEDKLQGKEMFATYLINKGLVSRLSEKSKNQKEKLGLMKIRPMQQTDISQKKDIEWLINTWKDAWITHLLPRK